MFSEPFAIGDSIIHRIDPRFKVVAAVAFSIVVAVSYRFPTLLAALVDSRHPDAGSASESESRCQSAPGGHRLSCVAMGAIADNLRRGCTHPYRPADPYPARGNSGRSDLTQVAGYSVGLHRPHHDHELHHFRSCLGPSAPVGKIRPPLADDLPVYFRDRAGISAHGPRSENPRFSAAGPTSTHIKPLHTSSPCSSCAPRPAPNGCIAPCAAAASTVAFTAWPTSLPTRPTGFLRDLMTVSVIGLALLEWGKIL